MAIKSNFPNMVITLLAITLISGAILGMVHKVTKGPIQEASLKAQNEAIKAILPSFDKLSDAKEVMPEDGTQPLTFFKATDAEGKLVGTAVKTYTIKGFSGYIGIMVGFDPNGTITGFQVLKHAETPGLGSKMQEWFSNPAHSIIGLNPAKVNMTVSKDGGDVDAITASTISSRAFLDAIVRGYNTYNKEGGAE
ncbi:MAG: RnfABCDGE type electron transport complex subunit G [Mangrovibacterium sp.]